MARHTFGINDFYRRQTSSSKYSYFSGTDDELLQAIEQHFPMREKGRRKGAWVIPLPGKMNKKSRFYTSVVPVSPVMVLNAQCLSRSSKEVPLVCATGVGKKKPAKYARAILYSKELLTELREVSTGADYDLVSIQASDVPAQPDHPYDIARDILANGASYDPREIAEAILYWGQHVFVRPKFTRHIDAKIAKLMCDGMGDAAYSLRRKQVPDETPEETRLYIDTVQKFLSDTGKYYC